MQVPLDRFLIEVNAFFPWPEKLQPKIRNLAENLTMAITPEVLGTFGFALLERAEAIARRALSVFKEASDTFRLSAIQLLEQLIVTRCPTR
jgi:hypothetical protein